MTVGNLGGDGHGRSSQGRSETGAFVGWKWVRGAVDPRDQVHGLLPDDQFFEGLCVHGVPPPMGSVGFIDKIGYRLGIREGERSDNPVV